jgi:hypothetical protein
MEWWIIPRPGRGCNRGRPHAPRIAAISSRRRAPRIHRLPPSTRIIAAAAYPFVGSKMEGRQNIQFVDPCDKSESIDLARSSLAANMAKHWNRVHRQLRLFPQAPQHQ